MQPLIEHRLTFAGTPTRVLELEGHGPALVLFHGFADSADTWRPTLAALGRADRRAIAVDLPGFASAGDLEPGAVLPQLDAFGAAVVEHAAEGGAVVAVGNSLGGCLALRLAEREDLPLAGVVPVAPAGLDMPRWFTLIERDPIVRTILAAPVPIPGPFLRLAVGEAYRNLAFARPRAAVGEVVRAFTSHHRDRATVARFLATGRRLLPELQEPFDLERIRCPVLIVWGDRDRMVYHRGAQRVVDALPDTEVVILDGCGHCPQVEEPERFVPLLLDFAPAARRAA
jgi:pimeloyl-ACP methyl ester carboxylesterase